MRCETTSVIFDWTFDGPVSLQAFIEYSKAAQNQK